jgi:hypothetical protein
MVVPALVRPPRRAHEQVVTAADAAPGERCREGDGGGLGLHADRSVLAQPSCSAAPTPGIPELAGCGCGCSWPRIVSGVVSDVAWSRPRTGITWDPVLIPSSIFLHCSTPRTDRMNEPCAAWRGRPALPIDRDAGAGIHSTDVTPSLDIHLFSRSAKTYIDVAAFQTSI